MLPRILDTSLCEISSCCPDAISTREALCKGQILYKGSLPAPRALVCSSRSRRGLPRAPQAPPIPS